MKEKINIVLFSGGSGTETITDPFRSHSQISLTILLNAYDDGHSTGRLRNFVPGMLGPSDVRKNINRLMPRSEKCHQALRRLSEHRLPMDTDFGTGMRLVEVFARQELDKVPAHLAATFELLTVKQAFTFSDFFQAFECYAVEQDRLGRRFDFKDCALGNILFAGCFLRAGSSFNEAIEHFSRFYAVQSSVLNVTRGENLFLVAKKEDGTMLRSEAGIVSAQNPCKIEEIFLLPEDVYRSSVENNSLLDAALLEMARQHAVLPDINPQADAALRSADLIIYGPGTQHSSLFPSYLTRGVAEAIAANGSADKIFISNIRRDFDIQREDASDLAQKFLRMLRRGEQAPVAWKDVVTHFFVQDGADGNDGAAGYVPFDKSSFQFPISSVKLGDWEYREGKHAGGYVFEQIQAITQSRMLMTLGSKRQLVSIIVPGLNEENTVEEALNHLMALDFEQYELSKEIIFIDGGSSDRTIERAKSVRGVKVFELKDARGRGAAMRLGISRAHGDLVVFFPADQEYRAQDILAVVTAMVRNGFSAVLGTRAVKCSLTKTLRSIYGNRTSLYLISKYGGMLLSMLTLVLYNKYITDTLTSVKGFDGKLLRSLDLRSDGMELDMEIIAKLSLRNQYILEVPVEYQPRTRAAGKKITVGDGLRALTTLVKYRFGPAQRDFDYSSRPVLAGAPASMSLSAGPQTPRS